MIFRYGFVFKIDGPRLPAYLFGLFSTFSDRNYAERSIVNRRRYTIVVDFNLHDGRREFKVLPEIMSAIFISSDPSTSFTMLMIVTVFLEH